MNRHDESTCAPHIPAENRLPLGDPERMGALMRSLEPRLNAVALGVTKDPDAAQDVLQNAFEKALRHAEQFRGQARVSTWLHRIVTNEALMWRRTQSRRRESPLEDCGDGPPAETATARSPAEHAEWRQQVDRLRDALIRLPQAEHEVLRSCVLEERSYADFGNRSGLHPAAVKSRAFRARRRLAKILRE
jgi:RNA polymerase sigma-70 factor (ECF subfamily)